MQRGAAGGGLARMASPPHCSNVIDSYYTLKNTKNLDQQVSA